MIVPRFELTCLSGRMLHHLKAHLKAHPSTASQPTRILVFALYKKEAQRIESTLQRNRFKVAGLHGDMGQNERFKALDAFKKGEVEVLVATDVAARGLDIPDVGLVLNVTFPLTTGQLSSAGALYQILTGCRGLCAPVWTNGTSRQVRQGRHVLHGREPRAIACWRVHACASRRRRRDPQGDGSLPVHDQEEG